MRLDFNVLWVDDQPNRVKAQITGIKTRMRAEGFNFSATLCRSSEDVLKRISDTVFNDQIDLIMVDWDLGHDVQGQNVIADIRDSIRYKEVIFYSAASNPDTLRKLAATAGLEGVYCASRDTLVDEVVGVFGSLVKKVLDLDHTRGIIMGSTSDIDHVVLECVTAVHQGMQDAEKTAFVQEVLMLVQDRIGKHAKDLDALQNDSSMAALLKAHHLFTANDRLRMLSRILKQEKFKDQKKARASVVTYMNKVVPRRNDLGHKMLLPDGKTMAIAMVGGEKYFSEEEMRDLRRTILGLREEFQTLKDVLRGADQHTPD